MNPTSVAELSKSAHFRELQQYLAGKALELNSLADIKVASAEMAAVEVMARQRAYAKLVEILGDLIDQPKKEGGLPASREYAVDVDEEQK